MALKRGLTGKGKRKGKAKAKTKNTRTSQTPPRKKRKSDSDAEDGYSSGSSISAGTLHASDSESDLGSWNTTDQVSAFYQPIYEAGQEFEVDAILRWRRHPRKGYLQYRTAWTGFPVYDTTWEPEHMFEDRKVISRFWEQQGGRPDDVPPPPDSDEEAPVLDPGEETESLKLYKGDVGRQARRKLRTEYRRDKVQLRQHWRKKKEEGSLEGDGEGSSSDDITITKPKRKLRLAVSDGEEEADSPPTSPKRIVAYPNGKKKSWEPLEESTDGSSVQRVENALLDGATDAQEGPETAKVDTRQADRRSSSGSRDSQTSTRATPLMNGAGLAASASISAPRLTKRVVPSGTTAHVTSGSVPASRPAVSSHRSVNSATSARPKKSAEATSTSASAKKRDRPLASASVARVMRQAQLKEGPNIRAAAANSTASGAPPSNGPTEAATATTPSAAAPASGAKIGQKNAAGSLLDMIAGPGPARPAVGRPGATAVRTGGGTSPGGLGSSLSPDEPAAAKGSFRGAHKNLSRINVLPEPPPMSLTPAGRGGSLGGRGGAHSPTTVRPSVRPSQLASVAAEPIADTRSVAYPNDPASTPARSPGHQEQTLGPGQQGPQFSSASKATVAPRSPITDAQTKSLADKNATTANSVKFGMVSVAGEELNDANHSQTVSNVPGRPMGPASSILDRPRSSGPSKTTDTMERSNGTGRYPKEQPTHVGTPWDASRSTARREGGHARLTDREVPPWERNSHRQWREDPSQQNPYAQNYYIHRHSSFQQQQQQPRPAESGRDAQYQHGPPVVPFEPPRPEPQPLPPPNAPAASYVPPIPTQPRLPVPQDPRKAKMLGARTVGLGTSSGSPDRPSPPATAAPLRSPSDPKRTSRSGSEGSVEPGEITS